MKERNSETSKNQEKRTYFNRKKQLRNSTQILKSCEMKVTQSCPTLCDTMDYAVHGILHTRILEWAAFPFSRGIFPTQGSNPGLPYCRWSLYQLSHKGVRGRKKQFGFESMRVNKHLRGMVFIVSE